MKYIKSNWLILLLLVVALPLGLYFAYKKFVPKVEGGVLGTLGILTGGTSLNDFQTNNNQPQSTLSDAKVKAIAHSVKGYLSGFSENEHRIMLNLLPLSENDFVRVQNAFGLVNLIPMYNLMEHYAVGERNLFFWLTRYLDADDLEKLKTGLLKL